MIEIFTIAISLISLIIAFVAIFISYRSISEQRRSSMTTIHYDQIKDVHLLLTQKPELLSLHGIEKEELERINVSEDEFIYIFLSLEASQVYYEIENKDVINYNDFSLYRKKFLSHSKVKAVWENIYKPKLSDQEHFVKAIDRFYSSNTDKKLPTKIF